MRKRVPPTKSLEAIPLQKKRRVGGIREECFGFGVISFLSAAMATREGEGKASKLRNFASFSSCQKRAG